MESLRYISSPLPKRNLLFQQLPQTHQNLYLSVSDPPWKPFYPPHDGSHSPSVNKWELSKLCPSKNGSISRINLKRKKTALQNSDQGVDYQQTARYALYTETNAIANFIDRSKQKVYIIVHVYGYTLRVFTCVYMEVHTTIL